MLRKTRGIVINYTKYRESSLIVKIYTEEFGLHSCLINGVRSKNSKTRMALFQPLTLLDLVIYYKEEGLSRISEARCSYPYKTLGTEPAKSAIAFFINEVLYKSLREETASQDLFDFLQRSLQYLDESTQGYENFHLIFLLKLSSFLGFNPEELEDLMPGEARLLDEKEKEIYLSFIRAGYEPRIIIDSKTRRKFLDVLLKFFSAHVSNFEKLNSLPVLQEVMRGKQEDGSRKRE